MNDNIFLYNIDTKKNIKEVIKYIKPQINYIFITKNDILAKEIYNLLKENSDKINLKYANNKHIINDIYQYIEISTTDILIKNFDYIVKDYNIIIDDFQSFNNYEKILIKHYLKETRKSTKHRIILQRSEVCIDSFFKENYLLKNIKNSKIKIKYIQIEEIIRYIVDNFKNKKRVLVVCNTKEDILLVKQKLKRYKTTNKRILVFDKNKPYEYIFKKNLLQTIPIILSDNSILDENIFFDTIIIQEDNNIISMAKKFNLQIKQNNNQNNINYIWEKSNNKENRLFKGNKMERIDINDIHNVLYIKQNLHKNILIEYIQHLKENNLTLTLEPIKIKYRNYLYKVNKIPFSKYSYDKNGEKIYLFIKSKSYIIINKEDGVLKIEQINFIKKEKNKIIFQHNNKEICAYKEKEE